MCSPHRFEQRSAADEVLCRRSAEAVAVASCVWRLPPTKCCVAGVQKLRPLLACVVVWLLQSLTSSLLQSVAVGAGH